MCGQRGLGEGTHSTPRSSSFLPPPPPRGLSGSTKGAVNREAAGRGLTPESGQTVFAPSSASPPPPPPCVRGSGVNLEANVGSSLLLPRQPGHRAQVGLEGRAGGGVGPLD